MSLRLFRLLELRRFSVWGGGAGAALVLIVLCGSGQRAETAPPAARSAAAESAAATEKSPPETAPLLPDGTAEAEAAIATFRKPEELEIEVYAAEPRLGSPVAITLDEQNRVYVAEQYRFNRGTEENRTRAFLLEDDLQLNTVDDRLAMYRKWAEKFDGGMEWFTRVTDQVRLLEDTTGDGRADRSTIFATGFNHPLDGLAAGLIAREGKVWFTCIPHLWLLEDADGDGVAEKRKSLHRGFGVNAAFLGHDLHGLCWGPDGRLYFSVGDRGFHVTTHEGHVLHGPRRGAVFRCEPDGAHLELIHIGLRNPQELAFDEFGNLFAADNNCDKGDHSRLVYVMEGADSGWNMAFQTIPEPYLVGPWHAEQMWHLPHEGQPAWLLPPVGSLGAGPSGFAYCPGTGLPERFAGRFFMCNYTGNGGIEEFGVQPKGAGFEKVDQQDFLKPIKATDIEFGTDGRVYVSDFVKLDWNGPGGRGRIFTLHDPFQADSFEVEAVRELFRTGFQSQSGSELLRLLGHADLRVRQRAQFALADKGPGAVRQLARVLDSSAEPLARRHAVWALWQIARQEPAVAKHLLPLVNDADAEIRAQAVRVLGDLRYAPAAESIAARLTDDSPRVQSFAAIAAGRLQHQAAIAPLCELLKQNDNQDPWLRHAAVMGLAGMDDVDTVLTRAADENAAVRLGVLLVLRRAKDPRISRFLEDASLPLVTEAARAINDMPIEEATEPLAAQIARLGRSPQPEPDALARRVLHANFRLGTEQHAAAVAAFAANRSNSAIARAEAVAALADWSNPAQRDRVNGNWRPLEKRDPAIVRRAVERHVAALLAGSEGELLTSVTRLIDQLGVTADEATFFTWLEDSQRQESARIAALNLLASRKSSQLPAAVDLALNSASPRLRSAARVVVAREDAARGLELLSSVLTDDQAELTERQAALAALATMEQPQAAAQLDAWAERLAGGKVPPEMMLDVYEAARNRATPAGRQQLEQFDAARTGGSLLQQYNLALEGGDPARGRELFVGHRTAQCIRCHTAEQSGGTAGPPLKEIAGKNPRSHLLESLIDPDAKIAKGFGSVALVLTSGKVVTGNLQAESPEAVTIQLATGEKRTIPQDEIEERSQPKSPMPDVKKVLSLREIRDLVAYLATLKQGQP
ncbi:MAG: HEAT repeat domain-containing protein [Planctomycetaceae bacterium]|nr:HEAT repeat domain-containing protein [Planctomycetaceae bacterium]